MFPTLRSTCKFRTLASGADMGILHANLFFPFVLRWLNLEGLPGPSSDGLNFFQACLEEKVIVVPGIFFDLNPSRRRDLFDSPCHHFIRFSYGPKLDVLKKGCDGIERVVRK